MLFRACPILCYWWPNPPSNRLGVARNPNPTHNPRNAGQISLTIPPSLLRLTEFLNNLDSLCFRCSSGYVRFSACCCGGGRKLLLIGNPPATQESPPDFAYSSTISSTEFLDDLVRLILPVRCKVCTILYLLLWWMPKASSNGLAVVENLEIHPSSKIS